MKSRSVTFRNCVLWFAAIAAFSLIFRAERPVKIADALWLCLGIFLLFDANFRLLVAKLWPRLRPYALYFLLLAGSIALAQSLDYAQFGTTANAKAFFDYARLLFNFGIFMLAAVLLQYDSRILRYASIAVFISPLMVLPAYWYPDSQEFLSGSRLRGLFSSPIDFSMWLMVAFLIGMALLVDPRIRWKKIAIILWLTVLGNFILWSGTRSVWLALPLILLCWAVLHLRRKDILETMKYFVLVPVFAFTVGYLLLAFSRPRLNTQKFIASRAVTLVMRPLADQENTRHWLAAGPLFLQNPLGFGFTNTNDPDPERVHRPDVNSYLEVAFNGGIAALAAFCLVLYALLRTTGKTLIAQAYLSSLPNLAIAWLLAAPAMLLAIFFTDAFLVRIIWITFGFSLGVAWTYAEHSHIMRRPKEKNHHVKKKLSELRVRIVAFVWRIGVKLFRGRGLQRVWPFGALYDWMISIFETYEWPESVNVQGYTIYTSPLHRASLALWGGKGDEPAFRLFEREIPRGGIVIDVGANIGHYTLHLAHAAGEKGKVFSFEPGQESLDFLNKNIAANNYNNITVIPKAVGDHSGKVNLFLAHESGGHQIFDVRKIIGAMPNPSEYHKALLENRRKNKDYEQSISVDLVSLDDFFKDYGKPIDFVKIDVEGAEDDVLAGMRSILRKNPGIKLFFEFTPTFLTLRGKDPKKMLEDLRGEGFAFYNMHDAKNHELLAESASIEQLLAACKGNMAIDIFAKRI